MIIRRAPAWFVAGEPATPAMQSAGPPAVWRISHPKGSTFAKATVDEARLARHSFSGGGYPCATILPVYSRWMASLP